MHFYTANNDEAEIWIVRADELKRAFRFRKGSEIKLAPNVIEFSSDSVIDELTVDEDERRGKPSHSKLTLD